MRTCAGPTARGDGSTLDDPYRHARKPSLEKARLPSIASFPVPQKAASGAGASLASAFILPRLFPSPLFPTNIIVVFRTEIDRGPVNAEASRGRTNKNDGNSTGYSHGKKIYTDYSITGIPGDGRCLFRSVMHGACLRAGKLPPDEKLQRELADELRARVADEFVKRRAETEWFVEGDFDTYVSTIRKPHVWGGEPELFMASHVLEMPITVYMLDEDAGGLIAIAEYGQEYGKDDPICVLYHGFGHYEALQIPGRKGSRSRL
ncbi:OTU-like cysteine protease [Musa troglodytarum]|uniref:Ubiquitin thioesterase OTU n=1 Tax=Musa troglodytarum TaxID=320322 RepID=A0A9E7G3F9_9LILI|nr:OTU-like cysteine protease [Musa troglodytarum]